MRRRASLFVPACAVSFLLASCASVIGLDGVDRVSCTEDCGADASLGSDAEADGTPEGAPADATSDGPARDAPTCEPGAACDGGRCDDAGACVSTCRRDKDCTAPTPVCDTATGACVPCMPDSGACGVGEVCVASGGTFACVSGCNTASDCPVDGGATAIACCSQACTNPDTDRSNCGGCGKACAGGMTATCVAGACSYTIGGTLANLPATTSIVLQDNGGDDLTLMADGAFTFTTPVVTGAPYAVTVKTAPAQQICSVTMGGGTVMNAAVTDVQVSCKSCYVSGTQTLPYTGGVQTFTVPCGVASITLTVDGAAGASNAGANVAGGEGGSSTGTLAVTEGQVLDVYVGGAGTGTTGGFNGGGPGGTGTGTSSAGGGGGASDVRIAPYGAADRVIVGGGGGGAGGDRVTNVSAGAGGGGGGGYFGGGGGGSWGDVGGSAGTASAAGGGGCGGCVGGTCGTGGSASTGGAGAAVAGSAQAAAGPGGAGGAGGGASGGVGGTAGACGSSFSGGGGGGGSGYVGGVTGGTTTAGTNSGDGSVAIHW